MIAKFFHNRMTSSSLLRRFGMVAAVAMGAMLANFPMAAQNLTALQNLSGSNGAQPLSGVVADNAGNLYVTSSAGGLGGGTVIQLSPANGGGWTQTVIYNFAATTTDGVYPSGAIVFDNAGNLYGTTEHGGQFNGGTAFELSPVIGGTWTETILHSFGNGTDGIFPTGGLAIDAAGNLYGTTVKGGVNKNCSYSGTTSTCGIAFQLVPGGGNSWTYNTIHQFGGKGDAYFPWAPLVVDSNGNLFGQCSLGGTYGHGMTFELSLVSGVWNETLVHAWGNGNDGQYPYSPVTIAPDGSLYMALSQTGVKGNMGGVFRLVPNGNSWTEQSVYYFGINVDGQFPQSSLVFDNAGNLYGTTQHGGITPSLGYGTLYRLTPTQGSWTETILYNFSGGADGGVPSGSMVIDNNNNIYGTTWYGGNAQTCFIGPIPGCGVVFQFSPQ